MNEVQISFIIPVYNAERYIHKCIDSILIQMKNYPIEILLINDGSTDGSERICSQYVKDYPDIVYLYNRNNQGQGNARNFGIDISRGKWITFLDNDDWMDESWFQECSEYITDEYDMIAWGKRDVYYNRNKDYFSGISNNIEIINHRELILSVLDTCYYKDLEYRGLSFATPWGKLFKSSIIREKKLRFVESYGEDRPFLLTVYEASEKIVIIKKAFYNYRIHESAMRKYLPDAIHKYSISVAKMNQYVRQCYPNDSAIIGALHHHNIAYFSNSVRQDFCNSKNVASYSERKEKFFQALNEDIYEEAFRSADFSKLPLRRRVLAQLIKERKFFLINLLSYINDFYDRYFVWGG